MVVAAGELSNHDCAPLFKPFKAAPIPQVRGRHPVVVGFGAPTRRVPSRLTSGRQFFQDQCCGRGRLLCCRLWHCFFGGDRRTSRKSRHLNQHLSTGDTTRNHSSLVRLQATLFQNENDLWFFRLRRPTLSGPVPSNFLQRVEEHSTLRGTYGKRCPEFRGSLKLLAYI